MIGSSSVRVLVPHRLTGAVPAADAQLESLAGRSMGCGWSVVYVSEGGVTQAELAAGIEAVLQRVVAQMSNWESGSRISIFNHAPAGSWQPLPADFALVLAGALYVARASDGALDPTAGPLVQLWGFGPGMAHRLEGFTLPTAQDVLLARKRCDWRQLRVDAANMLIFQPGGLMLDLSAVAKGFAVDEVSRYLRRAGITSHLVDIGGELRGAGVKPDGQPWWVQVQLPPDAAGAVQTRIALHGMSVATSGDYLQGFHADGRQYCHCIDPRSGEPITNGVCSVTVLHNDCMLADAWSTALMVLGPEGGFEVAERESLAAQWLVRTGGGVVEQCSSAYLAMVVEAQQ